MGSVTQDQLKASTSLRLALSCERASCHMTICAESAGPPSAWAGVCDLLYVRTLHTLVLNLALCLLQEIAETKLPDLNCQNIEAALKIIAGTAKGMGIKVKD